jgi:hypothetical protein
VNLSTVLHRQQRLTPSAVRDGVLWQLPLCLPPQPPIAPPPPNRGTSGHWSICRWSSRRPCTWRWRLQSVTPAAGMECGSDDGGRNQFGTGSKCMEGSISRRTAWLRSDSSILASERGVWRARLWVTILSRLLETRFPQFLLLFTDTKWVREAIGVALTSPSI